MILFALGGMGSDFPSEPVKTIRAAEASGTLFITAGHFTHSALRLPMGAAAESMCTVPAHHVFSSAHELIFDEVSCLCDGHSRPAKRGGPMQQLQCVAEHHILCPSSPSAV